MLAAGDLEGAVAAFEAALRLAPENADLLSNLGLALKQADRDDEAIAVLRRALTRSPHHVPALKGLHNLLQGREDDDGLLPVLRALVAAAPDETIHHANLANVLLKLDRRDESEAAFRAVLDRNADDLNALVNLASLRQAAGAAAEAETLLRRALTLSPDDPAANYNLSRLRLLAGDFDEGWRRHEYRWQCEDFQGWLRPFRVPRWDGSVFAGRTLLVHAEQGIGDTLQFLRYLPLAKARGGRVLLEVQRGLGRLLAGFSGADQIVERAPLWPADDKLPPYDLHCPLMSLPFVLGLERRELTGPGPYLHADGHRVNAWAEHLAAHPRPRVGLVWAGNPRNRIDAQRSFGFDALSEVLAAAGPSWFSLQVPTQSDRAASLAAAGVSDLGAELTDFAETAAVLANLDLLISADSAPAHLAGALGYPVWVPTYEPPEWRWLTQGTATHWYPTMRLFRQPAPGQWTPVFTAIAAALTQAVAASRKAG